MGKQGFVDVKCCDQTLVDPSSFIREALASWLIDFLSLSRHFSWSPPLPPLSIHQSG